MSARPGDWSLLGHDSDPVPGDDYSIALEANHFRSIAQAIQDEANRLRNLAASQGELTGLYADGLRSSCVDAADALDAAHGRFEAAGSQLGSYSTTVDEARRATATHLQNAEEAGARVAATSPAATTASAALTPLEVADEQVRATRHAQATDDLAGVKAAFESTMATFDSDALAVANAIRQASNDHMKDSTFDGFKEWVSQNAGWLSAIAEVLSWIATAVAVAALFCTPAGWIILLASAAMVLALGIHTSLALAGKGSWTDVALDVVGVATLGTGKLAVAVAKVGRLATLFDAGQIAGGLARSNVLSAARSAFSDARWLSKPIVWSTRANPVSQAVTGRLAYAKALVGQLTRVLPEVGPWQVLRHGMDREVGGMTQEIKNLTSEFGPEVIHPLYENSVQVADGLARTGAITDFGGRILSGSIVPGVNIPALDILHPLKKATTWEVSTP